MPRQINLVPKSRERYLLLLLLKSMTFEKKKPRYFLESECLLQLENMDPLLSLIPFPFSLQFFVCGEQGPVRKGQWHYIHSIKSLLVSRPTVQFCAFNYASPDQSRLYPMCKHDIAC